MKHLNEVLSEALIEESGEITRQWLLIPESGRPSDDQRAETQHRLLIEIVARIISEKDGGDEELTKWALQFARDRAVHEVPVYESVARFKEFRRLVWNRIQTCSETMSEKPGTPAVFQWGEKLNKAIDHMIEVFTEEYYKVTIRQLNAQKEMINELSAPIMPIAGIGIMPLVGEIDTYRAKIILESVLDQCSSLRLSYLFLDISGVPIVDTMVAYQIFKVIDSTKLLGIETTISGIRPEIAQTVVKLGIDFSQVKTEQSLTKALAKNGFVVKESLR
ncbi:MULTISPECIES: STAS domain-containing protein [Bacillus]|uniref:RsbR paralog n=1 Tax=Bacillus amyloliquefaciens (strain ATCC 23350 / DSM 7 / BCRC 11601 / CCUG 28519 / NBRC 15535 / NRRL B-14393 / F) TaxID=692420 RepID=A0A9P1JIA9_BACAS|nr:STAS domain-containing protein [Bacillus amyloliquefaciens]AEB64207.1 RsbT co-antagonist protein rsbRD [Bacillus amyloliquefaciens LL3]ARW39646.1 RsbT co-antagonist protein RsbRD [Bacillus amyloliquefaciens]AZV89852.1 RsbR-like protein [Bacillus amyloliquefaciens]MBW8279379.1 STAS domain-containing protein [Bacillus amyloliquefaciens]MDR4377559.1 STAS domain-containing protein [Bacillus amyloliquefaciens]